MLSRIREPNDEYERLLADKQRIIDSLSQTLTEVFVKSRNNFTTGSESTSQQDFGSPRNSGYHRNGDIINGYLTRSIEGNITSLEEMNSPSYDKPKDRTNMPDILKPIQSSSQQNVIRTELSGSRASQSNSNAQSNNNGMLRLDSNGSSSGNSNQVVYEYSSSNQIIRNEFSGSRTG